METEKLLDSNNSLSSLIYLKINVAISKQNTVNSKSNPSEKRSAYPWLKPHDKTHSQKRTEWIHRLRINIKNRTKICYILFLILQEKSHNRKL